MPTGESSASDSAIASAYLDTFVNENLPPANLQPEFTYELLSLKYPLSLNCGVELLDKMVEKGFGEHRCLRDGAGTEWTYSEVLDRANRIANVLKDTYSLVAGNRVLLRGPNNPWLAVCWLAVQKAGLVAVATMPMLRANELSVVIDKAKINLSLCDSRFTDELASVATHPIVDFGQGSLLEKAMNSVSNVFTNCQTMSSDIALIAFTSGTTGKPKGCMHQHRDVLAIADTFSNQMINPTSDDLFSGSPPLAFTFGLGALLVFPLRVGACALLLEAASPPILLEAITKHRVTIVATAPTAYRAMLETISSADISSLRVCVSAGEPLALDTRIRFEKLTGIKLIDGLGATEMLHVFISATGDGIRPGAIGKPVNGFTVTILDDNYNEVAPGVVGHLAVKGPTGCRYLNDDRQKNYVRNGWNLPGDAMYRDEDNYFWYQARADDMIISSGYNIAGPEVEAAVLTHTSIRECACVGVSDIERGMVVKAFIVLKDSYTPSDELAKEIQDHVKATIAPYKYPRLIEFRNELPKTATGKMQRYRLRSEVADDER